jgi:hypothetical protein
MTVATTPNKSLHVTGAAIVVWRGKGQAGGPGT